MFVLRAKCIGQLHDRRVALLSSLKQCAEGLVSVAPLLRSPVSWCDRVVACEQGEVEHRIGDVPRPGHAQVCAMAHDH